MGTFNYTVWTNYRQICLSFLEGDNFVDNFQINNQNPVFGQPLGEIIDLQNEKNLVLPLGSPTINDIANLITSCCVGAVDIDNKTNAGTDLKIKNNHFKIYFYTLAGLVGFESVKILHFWEFRTDAVQMNRKGWFSYYSLRSRTCCLRNFLMTKNSADEPAGLSLKLSLKQRKKQSKSLLDDSCFFPNNFIKPSVNLYSHLLTPNDEKTIKEFTSLKLYYPKLSTDDKLGVFSRLRMYIYESGFGSQEEIYAATNSLLNKLQNKSLFNLNCRDLFTTISLENETF